MAKDKLLLDTIKKQINKAKVVSFDIFDTLLVRPYVRPTDLFEHMEKAYERPGFATERKDAERRTRFRHKELEDVTFDMIYDEIDAEFKDMKQKEMDWEEMVLRANQELKQVYDYALEQGKKVIITSDMYLPTEFLAKVLHKQGYDNWDKLYVSGDIGKCKGRGTLFEHLLADNNIMPQDVLHIGDNGVTDVSSPSKLGISTIKYETIVAQYLKINARTRYFSKKANDLSASILIALEANRWNNFRIDSQKDNNYWKELGYMYAGPFSYGYMHFVLKTVEENHLNNLLFVARDGYTLERVFHVLNSQIKTSYVYAPRFVNLICRLDFPPALTRQSQPIVEYFAERNTEIKNLVDKSEFNHSDDYYNLIQDNLELFTKASQKYYNNYKNYINKYVGKNTGIVDTISRFFSSQTLIEKISQKKCLGIYWGILSGGNQDEVDFIPFVEGTCADKNKPEGYDLFTKNWDLIEFLIASPEYPIKNVDSTGKPEYNEIIDPYEQFRASIYPQISDGAVLFAQDVLKRFGKFDIFLTSETIVKWINSYIDCPQKIDFEYMSKIKFAPNLGHDFYIPLFCEKISPFYALFHYKTYKKRVAPLKWKTPFQRFVFKGLTQKINSKNLKYRKILGFTLYQKTIQPDKTEIKRFFGLIHSIKTDKRKKIYFMGIQVFSKKISEKIHLCEEDMRRIIDSISLKTKRMLTTTVMHQKTFSEFRNINQNKNAVLVGAGPSVKYFNPIKDAVYVGVNRAFLLSNVHFSYLFTIDKAGLDTGKEQFYDDFFAYDCIKFVGDQNMGKDFQIPQSKGADNPSVRRYKTTARHLPNNFSLDIDTEPLANSASSSLQAMQFILFTNPKRIYVVGIDCTSASMQHFIGSAFNNATRNENVKNNDILNIQDWKRIKGFINTYYPETEVIVVNPVGLRGIFHDVYTRSYLRKHPEIDADSVEILEEEEMKNVA